jgi:restriction system protein
MAIPDYQTLMLPLLQFAGDGAEHTLVQAVDLIADKFDLNEADRKELLPSGGQQKLFNRVGWARTYMAKAGLLESCGRGKFRITPRGLDVLKSKRPKINVDFLNQYPEFVEFRTGSKSTNIAVSDTNDTNSIVLQQTPQELLEISYQALHHQVAQELLERISKASPAFFEKLVVEFVGCDGLWGFP